MACWHLTCYPMPITVCRESDLVRACSLRSSGGLLKRSMRNTAESCRKAAGCPTRAAPTLLRNRRSRLSGSVEKCVRVAKLREDAEQVPPVAAPPAKVKTGPGHPGLVRSEFSRFHHSAVPPIGRTPFSRLAVCYGSEFCQGVQRLLHGGQEQPDTLRQAQSRSSCLSWS